MESDKFKKWHRLKTAEMLGRAANIDQKVAELMKEENLKVEYGTGFE